MNIYEHPNVKEYLAHFLLTLRKHAVLESTDLFHVEIRDEELDARSVELLK